MGFSQEDSLEQAIERLNAGESLEMILISAGSDAEWLKPMLSVAARVRDLHETVAVPPAETSLATFLAQAERMAAPALPARPAPRPWWERLADSLALPASSFPRLATSALATLLAVVALVLTSAFFLGTNAAAAQGVLPGQPLYPIKRLGEELVLRLPQSSEVRDSRLVEFEERRRQEVNLLLDHRLEARVTFRGKVEALSADRIVVDDIALQITDRTQIEGPLAVGAQVIVMARTVRDGSLIAENILVAQTAPPTPTSSPMSTPSATPNPTSTAKATATAASTPTQEPTPTPGPTVTPTTQPTHTPDRSASDILQPTPTPGPSDTPGPTPMPTEETPDEGNNENGDQGGDNGNNNSDEGNANDNSGDSDSGNDSEGDDNGDNSNDDSHQDSGSDSDSNDNDSSSSSSSDSDNSGKDSGEDNINDNSN